MTGEELFRNCKTAYRLCDRTVKALWTQNYDRGIRNYRQLLPIMSNIFTTLLADGRELGFEIGPEAAQEILGSLMDAQEDDDYMCLADLLDNVQRSFIAVLIQEMSQYVSTGEEIEKSDVIYHVDMTTTGDYTLRIERDGRFYCLHSTVDPVMEAELFVKERLGEDIPEKIVVLGLGLGHHVRVLLEETLYETPVIVFEPDENVIELCNKYGSLPAKVTVIHDPDLRALSKELTGEKGECFIIHQPSLYGIKNKEIFQSFSRFFVQESSARNAGKLLTVNFNANISRQDIKQIDGLLQELSGRTVYVVAAGPSLDKNVALLKNVGEDSFILACGTVLKKLLREGIKPDAFIVTDANDRVVGQIRGAQDAGVPMLFLATANRGFAREYRGEKYILFQNGFEASEREAKEKGVPLFETGGSVATTALDFVIKSGAEKAVFLGLDLAFTGNLAHAEGTSNRIATDTEKLTKVAAWHEDGEKCSDTVMADDKFIIYRTWMERRLLEEDAKKKMIINATEGGSYIKGMKHIALEKV